MLVVGRPGGPGGWPLLAFVLVIWGHIAHALVQSDRVVVHPGDVEFSPLGGGVADREQVRVLALEVPVQAFDPGLVGGGAGPAEVLGRLRTGP